MLQVDNALTSQKKKDTVNKLKKYLKTSILAVNIQFQGVTMAELQEFRRSLPEDAHFTVIKNNLIRIASNEVNGWSNFSLLTKFDSGVLLVEERIGDAIQERHRVC